MTKTSQVLPMHQVVVVVYPGFELLDAFGPSSVFNTANWQLAQLDRPPFYDIRLVSADGGVVRSSAGIAVETASIASLAPGQADTLLVTGAEGEHLLPAVENPVLRAQLPALANTADRFGSVCSGGYLLAAVGLLDGRRTATHWAACEAFADHFPQVSVDPDALYVVDDRIWTSAGVTTGIDMALAMVAKDLDATIAGAVAKRLVLYARRPGYQSQFSPLLQAQARADSPFADLIDWIQSNLDAPLDVSTLADRAGMTERTFHRKFLAATGKTPAYFVETARLDAARMLLSRGVALKAVAAQVGLSPSARLSEVFERRFGMTPTLFREMHAEL